MSAVQVSMDGRTFDFTIDPEVLTLDPDDPGAQARRDTFVRRELAKWNPATADAQLEWSTSPEGGTLIKVTREAKTKGQERPPALSPVLAKLLAARQEVPAGLLLSFTLKALEVTGRLKGPILLALQGRIEAANASTSHDAEYGSRVLRYLEEARAVPGPCTPLGF